MKLTVKTLKGEKFAVEVETSCTIGQVKTIIEGVKSELPSANMKLIHSGKVLKDDQTIEGCNVQENDFLVVMVTKAKKAAAAPKPAAAPAPSAAATAAAPETPATPAPAAAAATPAAAASTTVEATPAPSSSTSTEQSSNPPPAPSRPDEFPAEVVSNLTGMGFPEAEVKACLRASNGNPDIAVEFLTNGIPEAVQLQQSQPSPSAPSTSTTTGGGGAPLQALRDHPQFDALRRLVQSNPQMLQQVLTQIGQQQPELLQEINANQQQFLAMMNEPVSDAPVPAPAAPSSSSSAPAVPSGGGGSSSSGAGGNPMAGMLGGMADPAQMAQMLQNMSPNELNEMATMMGLTPEQLQATVRMIGQIPPDQLQEYMAQAMAGGGAGGMMGGAGGGFGGAGAGPQVLRLNEEEMAAVDRLTEMGFDRAEAAQAFLACDKNEALAANLLMDSAGQDGGAFGFGDDSGGGQGGGADDGDDMYD
mmetsp:Transcript_29642/g.45476  ORF Transcript_29642/g.45476 Transcript_29642/m.45476 type:complete len:475 (-) Transcript_29642:86-1510(-)